MTRTRARVAAVAALATAVVATTAGTALAAPDRPGVVSGSTWQLRNALSSGGPTTSFGYGRTTDVHVTGDWDGNGTKTAGIVRAVGGNWVWYLRNSNSTGGADVPAFAYGKPFATPDSDDGDLPIAGDWNGDGKDGPGVVRLRYGSVAPRWLLRDVTTSGIAQNNFAYGSAYDTDFVTGDWDGSGTDTPGLFRAYQNDRPYWLLRNANSSGPAQSQFQFGSTTQAEAPVAGDWNGDGTAGIGLLRYENGRYRWLLRETATAGSAQHSFVYGNWGQPVVVWS